MMQGLRIALLLEPSATTAAIIAGMDAHVRSHQLPWTLTSVDYRAGGRRGLRERRGYDGVIGFLRDQKVATWAAAQECPLIQLSSAPPPSPRTVCIRGDDTAIGALAARHCLDQGYRSFACHLRNRNGADTRRLEGFIDELARLGHSCHVRHSRRARGRASGGNGKGKGEGKAMSADAIESDFVAWLSAMPRPVAFFCHQDRIAFDTIEMCTLHGLRVPRDVAVLGVDDIVDVCEAARPPLSSVALPWRHIGSLAALHLHRMLGDAPGGEEVRVAPLHVTARASTATVVPDDPLAAACLAIIEREHANALGAAELAERLGVNRSTLYRRLQSATGAGFEQHLHRVRIARARELLRAGNEPIATIAARIGYPRRQAFHAHFRRLVGCTPQVYRER